MRNIACVLAAAVFGVAALLQVAQPVVAGDGPLGFQILCMTTPGVCRGGGASQIAATEEVMQTLRTVNSRVNRSIRPRADGNIDIWKVNATSGDCEEYALAKRAHLIRSGLPASALRLASVKTRDGRDHAILIVITSAGSLVLDNLSAAIKPLSQTPYRVLSMQTANPKNWTGNLNGAAVTPIARPHPQLY